MDSVGPEVLAAMSRFGAAGLIGWMWLSERRSASRRDQQLSEAHEQLRHERVGVSVLVGVVRRNTRALGRLEAQQRAFFGMLKEVSASRTARGDRGQGPSRGP